MKIALAFRGISFLEKYNLRTSIPEYCVDFRDCYESIKKYIIDSYIENGDTIDIYITSYHSKLEQTLLDVYKPKKYVFNEYIETPPEKAEDINGKINIRQHIDLLNLIKEYENESNTIYDTVIITRFDLYFYQKFTNINIDYNVFNSPFWHMNGTIFSTEDNLLILPRNKLDSLYTILNNILLGHYNNIPEYLIGKYISCHQIGKFLLDSGETVQYLYGEKGEGAYDYPIYKFGRHIFGNAKKYTIEEILKIPMNRIYHSQEEKNNPIPISLKLK